MYYLDTKGVFSSIIISKTKGIYAVNLKYMKEISNIAHFLLRSKYAYTLSEDGLLTKLNPSSLRVRYQHQLDTQEEDLVFTGLHLVKDSIIVSSISKSSLETSTCQLTFMTRKRKVYRTVNLETKSFKLRNENAEGSFYDLNPILSLASIARKHLQVILAAHYGFTVHLLALNGRRVHYLDSKCLNKGNLGMICGIVARDNTAFIFGWRSMLMRIAV